MLSSFPPNYATPFVEKPFSKETQLVDINALTISKLRHERNLLGFILETFQKLQEFFVVIGCLPYPSSFFFISHSSIYVIHLFLQTLGFP
jgi:hypothetical protein